MLQQAVRADPSPEPQARVLTVEEQARLVDLALVHRVAGRLDAHLGAVGITLGEDARRRLALARRRASAQHLLAGRTLGRLGSVLDAHGIDWLVVKGPAVAALYASPDHRTSTDVDIVVRRSDFAAAYGALTTAGFASLNENWGAFLRHGVAETPLADGDVVVDLHWHTVGLGAHRRHIDIDIDELFDRRRLVSSAGSTFATLDTADTLLHLCLHAALGGGRRLVWFCDVDTAIRCTDIDWNAVVARARRSGHAAMTSTMLCRTRRLLGTPISDEILDDLGRPKYLALIEGAVDLRQRTDVRRLDGWQSGVVLACTRDSVGSSFRAAEREVRKQVRQWRSPNELTGMLDWNVASGGEDGEARWLDYVTSSHR